MQPTLLEIQVVPLLTILGSPGDTDRIEYVNAFGDTNVWIPLTNVVLGGGAYEFYDRISPPGAKRFWPQVSLERAGEQTEKRSVWVGTSGSLVPD